MKNSMVIKEVLGDQFYFGKDVTNLDTFYRFCTCDYTFDKSGYGRWFSAL